MIAGDDFGPVGYYRLLGLQYGCTNAEIASAFRRAALTCHPDHQGDRTSDNNDMFEMIQTARAVLSDADCRAGYDRILYLRTLLHQHDNSDEELDPWLCFSVTKLNRSSTSQQHRILIFNFIEKSICNYRKSELRKKLSFGQIRDVVSISKYDVRVVVAVSSTNQCKEYTWRCRTEQTRSRLQSVVVSVMKGRYTFISDDRVVPDRSYLKGRASIRKNWKGGLGTNWRDRYIMIGATNLLIFRTKDYEEIIDCISLRDVVFGSNAGINHGGRFRTLPLFWRHSKAELRGFLGIDPALILRFDSVSEFEQWTAVLERILTQVEDVVRPISSPHSQQLHDPDPVSDLDVEPTAVNRNGPDPHDVAPSNDLIDAAHNHEHEPVQSGIPLGDFESSRSGSMSGSDNSNTDDDQAPERAQSEQLAGLSGVDKGGGAGIQIPVRVQSEPIQRHRTESDADPTNNLILRLITVRDEINQHKRRLDHLLKLEKQLVAERERQVLIQIGQGDHQLQSGRFLTDLAHRFQSLFSTERRSLI